MPGALSKAAVLGLGAAALAHGMTCPSGLDPYSSEPSPFGWPITPAEWQFAHPECWAEKYPLCAGDQQSPMALRIDSHPNDHCENEYLGTAGHLRDHADYKVLGARSSVTISKYMRATSVKGDLGSIMLKDSTEHDVKYKAVQAYLTSPSLHSVDGRLADGELLIVHKREGENDGTSGSVIVSVLFHTNEAGGQSELFSQFGFDPEGDVADFEKSDQWRSVGAINIAGTVDAAMEGDSFSYQGSVPVPPCSQNVHYIVLGKEMAVSQTQVEKLKKTLTTHTGGYLKRPNVDPIVHGEQDVQHCRRIDVNAPTLHEAMHGENIYNYSPSCSSSPIDVRSEELKVASTNADAIDFIAYKPTDSATVSRNAASVDVSGHFGALFVNGRHFEATKVFIRPIAQHTFDGERHAAELIIEHQLFGEGMASPVVGLHSASDAHSSAPTQSEPASVAEGAARSATDDHSGEHRRLESEDAASVSHSPADHGEEHKVMVSVPLKLGRESSLLRAFGIGEQANRGAIRDGNTYIVDSEVDLTQELRTSISKAWYWYSGGPIFDDACPDWGIKWMVFEEPLDLSIEQLNFLAVPISGFDSSTAQRHSPATDVFAQSLPEDAVEEGGWQGEGEVCSSGVRQSPINVETSMGVSGSDNFLAKASWKPVTNVRVMNMGNHLAMRNTQLGYFTLTAGSNGLPKYYQVSDVKLRMPSEHLVDGKQYPAELQIIHKNQKSVLEFEDDDVVVSSFLFDLGEENKLLKQMLQKVPTHDGDYHILSQPVDLMWALGPSMDGNFFKYDGSLTTAGCEEVAQWLIFERTFTMSSEQWQAFKSVFKSHSGSRPLKAINGRRLQKNAIEEFQAKGYDFFLSREASRDRAITPPGYIIFPIVGTLSLCLVMMAAIFQREDRSRRETSAGGVDGASVQAAPIGKSYNRF